jgi:uncharacterized protein (DUF488 family)
MTDLLTLYTIGHSNLSKNDFLAALRKNDIAVLVDVRSAPYSRYVPHFNKSDLEVFLKENDIDYRYAGEYLGGQPKDEAVYKHQVVPDDDTSREKFLKLVDYEAVMQQEWYQRGIKRLLEIVAQTRKAGGHVAIMCSEGDPLDCHRHHLIARSLLDATVKVIDIDIEVQHIVKDGNIEAVDQVVFKAKSEQPKQPRLL